MKSQSGFSLIELMTVVVIVSILAAIVVPSYRDYVMRGKVTEATTTLAAKRVQMEQFYQDNRTYAGGTACNNDTASSRYFTFSCPAAADAISYTIEAEGRDSMAGFTYTIDQNNTKTSTIASPAPSGWRASNAACWIIKQGGAC